jgi:hypothetical protein
MRGGNTPQWLRNAVASGAFASPKRLQRPLSERLLPWWPAILVASGGSLITLSLVLHFFW